MSAEAQAAEMEGEYHREEKREQKAMDSKHTASKISAQLVVKAYDDNLSTGSFKSGGGSSPATSCGFLPLCLSQGRGT